MVLELSRIDKTQMDQPAPSWLDETSGLTKVSRHPPLDYGWPIQNVIV
jgi:hypothetical protein